jgi:Cellulose biosynthesis GIL
MDDATAFNAKAPAVRIGIRGLTHTKSMLGGSIYLLIAETTSARFPMLAGSIAGAFEDGLLCTLIVPGNTSQFIQRIERLARINTAELVASNQLQIFMTQDNFLKKMFQFGADRFVGELGDFGIPKNSFLIFDQADELLSLHDISLAQDQINVLKEWFSQRGITVLLVFSRFTDAHNNTVNAIMDSLGGIVRLGGAREGLELKFDYWQSPTSVIAAKNYQIETLDTGLYKASTKTTAPDPFSDEEIQDEIPTDRQMLAYEDGLQFVAKQPVVHLDRYRGYLKPQEFVREVNRNIDQVNISCSLMVAMPSKRTTMSDIIKLFDRSSRIGELITADDRQCYIYFNTDLKSIVLDNLEIVLGLPVGIAFDQYRVVNTCDEIRMELDAVSYAVQSRASPDFSLPYETPVPQQMSQLSSVRGKGFVGRSSQTAVSAESVENNDISESNSESLVAIDFELAKRSVSLHPNFIDQDVLSAESLTNLNSELKNRISSDFDIKLEGPIFEKNAAPRAKRSLN